jgi:hypothetical protein
LFHCRTFRNGTSGDVTQELEVGGDAPILPIAVANGIGTRPAPLLRRLPTSVRALAPTLVGLGERALGLGRQRPAGRFAGGIGEEFVWH